MSKYSESLIEFERAKESTVYKDFEEMAMKFSNLGVATAAIGGILRKWCTNHNENLMDALVLMGVSHIQAKELSNKLREDS